MKKGKVYLVGGGPGDFKLITVKGQEALKKADVIVYDRLVNPRLLDYAKPDCELIFGGKLPKRHIMRQDQLNERLITEAQKGKIVVRLKGGDPSVFGRVGEEAAELKLAGVDFEIVPGITSGIAAPVYAGIPVTHRDYGTSFAVVTAHGKGTNGEPIINWSSLIGIDSIAFYMGIANLAHICEKLMEHGKSPATPVILLQWGTYSRQKQLQGTLETIAEQARMVQFKNPSIIFVGEIVNLREKMNWFESKPLFGRHILLARTSNGDSKLALELEEQGAEVVQFPRWKKEALPIDQKIITKLTAYERIFFTSPDCMDDFFNVISRQGIDIREIKAKLFVGSSKSKQVLLERGLFARVESLENIDSENLLLVKDQSLTTEQMETKCDVMITSKKIIDDAYLEVFERRMENIELDTVIFPSSQSVNALLKGIQSSGKDPKEFLENLTIACLGSKTKRELEGHKLNVTIYPESPKVESLLELLKQKN
ncbi:uroporphyrinogen-III C-methyltransferase [Aquibacillus kalidii]|uniref:uroporphyrinogen-III C-methyltransferase n=1 Tax=Aquibacillus kalidii TaxID=2762597 RepID=UPI0016450436|nr:uroporphyrinogen-III C-methyltransferase [Aquibacillus kalidii]